MSSKSSSKPIMGPTSAQGEEQTNFAAMLLGMIASIVIVFGVFGFGDDGRTERNRQKIADRDRAERLAIEKESSELKSLVPKIVKDKDEKIDLSSMSLGTLSAELIRLRVMTGDSIQEQANLCQAKIKFAKAILKKNPTGENRQIAICELIKANNKLYGIDFSTELKIPGSSENLRVSYEPYLEDTNQPIYQAARLALLTHKSFDHIQGKSLADTDDLSVIYTDTISRFPDNEYVASIVEYHFGALEEIDPPFAARLFNEVQRKSFEIEKNPSEVVQQLFQNLSDKFLLREVDYDNKYDNRWVHGTAGRHELTKVSLDLLEKENIGAFLLRRIDRVAFWQERHDHADGALKIYRAMKEATDSGRVVVASNEVGGALANNGIQRCSIEGKPFLFEGVDSVGSPLVQKDFADRIVIVIFWSRDNKPSMNFLRSFDKSAYDLTAKAIRVLAVCVDDKLDRDLSLFKRRAPCIRIVAHQDAEGNLNSIYKQCPPSILPHTMIVNHKGIVADANVKPEQVKNEAMGILLNRSD